MAESNQKGRTKSGERYVRLTNFMTGTLAWLSLTPAQRAVYCELARVYNGSNNGWLGLSVRTAAARCNINKDTAAKAFRVLEERGFIERVTQGGFSRKTPHSAEWRLTEWPCDKSHAALTKAYQNWRPAVAPLKPSCKTRSQSGGHAVPKEGTVTPFRSPKSGQRAAI